jgi:ammonium transporter Rh
MVLAFLLATAQVCLAQDGSSIENVQKYDRSIQIMAMLLVGFGFLMVFLRRYGRSALTATFLLTSTALPIYLLLDSGGVFGSGTEVEIDRFVMAEFAAASLLICAGACLGRLKMWQYIVLAALFIPFYAMNEWIVLENGFNLIERGIFIDTGGSIVIHAFGAIFGMGVVIAMTHKSEKAVPIESDFTSDRFSMLGSMILWVFWPGFCAALVSPEQVPYTAVNVVLALCGSTLATYGVSVTLRRKVFISDIANASLAGGVAIGATCVFANHPTAFLIGILAGTLSTFGFAGHSVPHRKSIQNDRYLRHQPAWVAGPDGRHCRGICSPGDSRRDPICGDRNNYLYSFDSRLYRGTDHVGPGQYQEAL